MRKLVVPSLVLSLAIFGAQNALAQNSGLSGGAHGVQNISVPSGSNQNTLWDHYSANERVMLDRIAADFFEANLRLSQSRKIEAATLDIYLAKSPEDRAAFREERRQVWNAMNEAQRQSARNVKLPIFSNLTEVQKTPFRQIALEQLAPASAPQESNKATEYPGGDV